MTVISSMTAFIIANPFPDSRVQPVFFKKKDWRDVQVSPAIGTKIAIVIFAPLIFVWTWFVRLFPLYHCPLSCQGFESKKNDGYLSTRHMSKSRDYFCRFQVSYSSYVANTTQPPFPRFITAADGCASSTSLRFLYSVSMQIFIDDVLSWCDKMVGIISYHLRFVWGSSVFMIVASLGLYISCLSFPDFFIVFSFDFIIFMPPLYLKFRFRQGKIRPTTSSLSTSLQ